MDEVHSPEGSTNWYQVSIQVSLAAAEGLANLLFEMMAEGLLLQEEASGIRFTAYFPSTVHLSSQLQIIESYLSSLKGLGIDPSPLVIQAAPWMDRGEPERWRDFFKPLLSGKRLAIKPSGETYCADPFDVVAEIDPGMAFGTGRNPSTVICLRFLERRLREGGERVLDLGTGSGIPAIAAARLEAGSIMALEIDPLACRAAERNFEINGARGRVKVGPGPVSSLRPQTFDIIVANLTLGEISPLLLDLYGLLHPDNGVLYLAGILRREMDIFRGIREASLVMVEMECQREWLGAGFKRRKGDA